LILSFSDLIGGTTLNRLIEGGPPEQGTALLRDDLLANDRFRRGVQPLRFGPAEVKVILARGDVAHLSTPTVAAGGGQLRADVEVFCFLTDPASYAGGELVIDIGYGEVARKDAAGSCVAYPTAVKRRVAEITEGQSHIATIEVQSSIRDPQQREILYDLKTAADFFVVAGVNEGLRLLSCCDGLLGLWAEV
jgi:PKHD-type hydroxylase